MRMVWMGQRETLVYLGSMVPLDDWMTVTIDVLMETAEMVDSPNALPQTFQAGQVDPVAGPVRVMAQALMARTGGANAPVQEGAAAK